MGGCPQTCMIKLRIAPCSALPQCSTHSHPAPRRPLWRPCVALCSCVGARKCPQDRICGHIRLCGRLLAVSYILVAMGRCPQTCMIKLRIAPRFGAPAMLHTFAPRPAAAALAALRCSVLMCGRSQMSARPDMRAYPSLRPLARCLIILSDYLYKIKHQC